MTWSLPGHRCWIGDRSEGYGQSSSGGWHSDFPDRSSSSPWQCSCICPSLSRGVAICPEILRKCQIFLAEDRKCRNNQVYWTLDRYLSKTITPCFPHTCQIVKCKLEKHPVIHERNRTNNDWTLWLCYITKSCNGWRQLYANLSWTSLLMSSSS